MNHENSLGKRRLFEYWFYIGNADSVEKYREVLSEAAEGDSMLFDYIEYMDIIQTYIALPDSVSKGSWWSSNLSTLTSIISDSSHGMWTYAMKLMNQYYLDSTYSTPFDLFYFPIAHYIPGVDTSSDVPSVSVGVSPSPFTSTFSVQVTNNIALNRLFLIKIFDLSGSLIESDYLSVSASSTNSKSIGSSVSGNGFYFLNIYDGATIVHSQLIQKVP